MVQLLSHGSEWGCEAMKTYSIPTFLPTSSGIIELRHQSKLRRCQDLNLGPQHMQSGAQSSELPHLLISSTELPHLPELPHLHSATISPLSYHISSELPHLLLSYQISAKPPHFRWATTFPLSYHISTELPHLHWDITFPLSYHISAELPHLRWATTSPLNNHVSAELSHLHWATTSPLSYHISLNF
jgi:hypothetical protein